MPSSSRIEAGSAPLPLSSHLLSNAMRLHSAFGYRSPNEFELPLAQEAA